MLKRSFHKIFLGCCSSLLLFVICFAVFLKFNKVEAASNCGDVVAPGLPVPVACGCGDTVMSNYTLNSDLICTGWGNALTIGASNVVIDGQDLVNPAIKHKIRFNMNGAFGYGIYSNNYNNITIRNLTFENIANGIYITATVVASNILIDNNVLTDNHFAITTTNTDIVTISNNTIAHADSTAILLLGVDHNLIDNNIFIENGHTIWASSIQNSIIQNNQFIKNRYKTNITTVTGNTIQNNTLTDNSYNHMITFNETAANRVRTVRTPISLDIDLIDYSILTACPAGTCTYTINTYPTETVTTTLVPPAPPGNKIQASFIPSKNGTYSVKITATDINTNTESRLYRFFIGPVVTQNITYYLNDIIPTHGQSNAQDSGSLLQTPAILNGDFLCDYWIQASIDQQPDYPISTINNISSNIWYKMNNPAPPASGLDAWTGLQRYGTRYVYSGAAKGILFDSHVITPYNTAYTKPSYTFPLLNWALDYPWNWYELMFKMETAGGTAFGGNDGPNWKTDTGPINSSQITINYSAPTAPLIKSISNPDINILSATQLDPAKPNNIELVVDGTGNTDIVLGNFTSPFDTHESIIYPDQTTKLELIGLAGTSTYQTVNLDAVPDSGNIKVNIITWDTGALHYKKWTEDGSLAGIVTTHNVGDLAPWTEYTIKVDAADYVTKVSNGQGIARFVYNGGYSTKTFELVEGAFVGAPSSSGLVFSTAAQVIINTNQPETTSENVTLTLTSTEATQMLISNDPLFDSAAWEPFTSSKAWSLTPGLGEKTVYVKLRNYMGATSPIISDSITLVSEIIPIVPTPGGSTPTLCQDQLPAGITTGNLLKIADSTTVYFIGVDNCRHSFPNEPTYFTWFADFSGILTIPMETISQIKLGKNVTVRPGTALVKIQSQPQVYMVETGVTLRGIGSESLAIQLFGYNWPSLVIDIPDTFFTDYTIGEPTQVYSDGALIQYANDDKIYYLDNGQKMLINQTLIYKLFQIKYIIHNVMSTISYPTGLDFPDSTMAEIMNWQ